MKNTNVLESKLSLKLINAKGAKSQTIFLASTYLIEDAIVNVGDIAKKTKGAILLEIQHNHLQTLLDLNNIRNKTLLSFNADGRFMGATMVNVKQNSIFQVLNQGSFILLISPSLEIKIERIQSLNIVNKGK